MLIERRDFALEALVRSAQDGLVAVERLNKDVADTIGEIISKGCLSRKFLLPSERFDKFLTDEAGRLFLSFEIIKSVNPDRQIHAIGEKIGDTFNRLRDSILDYVRYERVKHGVDLPRALFVPRLISDITNPALVLKHFKSSNDFKLRNKVINRIVSFVRWTLFLMRDVLRKLEETLPDYDIKIRVSPYASGFVKIADRECGLLVMNTEEGKRAKFNVTQNGVWECLTTLLETEHPCGLVKLPKGFRGRFSTLDKAGNQVKDDLYRLSLHIHSAGEGMYFLSPIERTPNKCG